jgi:hypothetical protein
MVVTVKTAPTRAAIAVSIYVGGVLWMTLMIVAGATEIEADASMIAGAATVTAGSNIRLDMTGVGATFPGADLSARTYY